MHVSYFGTYVELLSVECECGGGIISEEVLRSSGRLFLYPCSTFLLYLGNTKHINMFFIYSFTIQIRNELYFLYFCQQTVLKASLI